MATFILTAGGWQGGWVYENVANALVSLGHEAVPITLSGLGDVTAPTANLDTHIREVVDAVKSHDDVVLVGHSYAGMVVSGAADIGPAQIRASVYVDAYVPESGDSVWSLTTPKFREMFIEGAKGDGMNCAPPPSMDSRCRPHPMGSFLQAIRLTGKWREVPRKIYVGAHGWEGSPFLDLYQRLNGDPNWTTVSLDCGHNVARLKPDALADILLAQV